MPNFRLRFGFCSNGFWEDRSLDKLTELVNICFTAKDEKEGRDVAESFINHYNKQQNITIQWLSWISPYERSNPFIPGIQHVKINSKYSKPTTMGKYYLYVFMKI